MFRTFHNKSPWLEVNDQALDIRRTQLRFISKKKNSMFEMIKHNSGMLKKLNLIRSIDKILIIIKADSLVNV